MVAALSVENALFLLAVRRLKRLQHKRPRRLYGQWIVREFIVQASPFEVNVSAMSQALVGKVADSLLSLPLSVFASAEKEAEALMHSNNWRWFTASSAYTVCCVPTAPLGSLRCQCRSGGRRSNGQPSVQHG